MADLSQTARNPNGDFLRGTPTNPAAGSLFFEAPVLNQPRRFGLTTGGMTEQRNLGGGSDYTPTSNPFSNMTQAERAAYYAANPTMAAITQFGQKAFGLTSLGALQKAMQPNFVTEEGLIAMGVNPATYQAAKESFRSLEQKADPEYYGFGPLGDQVFSPEVDTSLESQGAYSAPAADANQGAAVGGDVGSISDQNTGGDSGGYGGYSDSAGSDSFGGGEYNMGGLVDRVGGPNPPGPDDGAGMLQLGEYVIKKSAVDKYGTGLLDMINMGKISTGAIPAGNPVLAKTWDAAAAQKAKMLEDMGADPKTIWQQTGTWKGLDGKWRQEVMQ